jgi:hypothetical protein
MLSYFKHNGYAFLSKRNNAGSNPANGVSRPLTPVFRRPNVS